MSSLNFVLQINLDQYCKEEKIYAKELRAVGHAENLAVAGGRGRTCRSFGLTVVGHAEISSL